MSGAPDPLYVRARCACWTPSTRWNLTSTRSPRWCVPANGRAEQVERLCHSAAAHTLPPGERLLNVQVLAFELFGKLQTEASAVQAKLADVEETPRAQPVRPSADPFKEPGEHSRELSAPSTSACLIVVNAVQNWLSLGSTTGRTNESNSSRSSGTHRGGPRRSRCAQTPMGPPDKRHGSADRELTALIAPA